MSKLLFLSLFGAAALWPQGISLRAVNAARVPVQPMALVQPTDMVFPHLATGGGWETLMLLLNMGSTTVDFTQAFYDDSGLPMMVRFRTIPDNHLVDTATIEGHLPAGSSVCVTFYDSTSKTQSGWSILQYDATKGRIGGYAAFRLAAGGITNEGLVPLSSYSDTSFMLPFDNTLGYITAVALANPTSDRLNHVQVIALDRNGTQIGSDTVDILANGHIAYLLKDRMPGLAGQAGTLVMSSNVSKLSALGIRMNLEGGMTFTSIPILSWAH